MAKVRASSAAGGIRRQIVIEHAAESDNVFRSSETVDVDHWTVPLSAIYLNETLRVDASHYDLVNGVSVEVLRSQGMEFVALSELADVILPSMFTRVWAESAEYGLPYFNATDMFSLITFGTLQDKTRYVSFQTNTDLSRLRVSKGWLILTCSGTIGRVFYVPDFLEGWIGTHDLIRIIPKPGVSPGYLYAMLNTDLVQQQINAHTHGGQIDHVTDDQIKTVLIPRLEGQQVEEYGTRVISSLMQRDVALKEIVAITEQIKEHLSK